MKKPKCKLCGSPHYTYEGHSFSGELRNQTPTVTKPTDEIVTSTVRISPEKIEEDFKAGRISFTHGGIREGSGRKRQHATNVERQRAYRERSKG